ncbi:MAG: hypothetical protein HY791_36355 [Deltaproteobacteria bacterium]|nr:hypothetical protein [Deltaproteobacteria bacterium]
MSDIKTRITAELTALDALGSQIPQGSSSHNQFDGAPCAPYPTGFVDPAASTQLGEWTARSLSLLRKHAPSSSFIHDVETLQKAGKKGDQDWYLFERAKGAMAGFKAHLHTGLLEDIEGTIRRAVHSDFLEQAESLLAEDPSMPDPLKVAATVLAGAVLEDALRKLLAKHNVPPPAKSSLSTLNEALRKASVFDTNQWGLIDSWGRLRNSAAHGEPAKVPSGQVQPMIMGIRSFLAQFGV